MRKAFYIQTDDNTTNLVKLLLQEIGDLKASVCKLNPPRLAQLFTEKAAAEMMSISEKTLYSLRREGKISYHKLGINIRYSLGDILEYQEKCKRET